MTSVDDVTASCSFDACSDSMIGRVIGALVDQLCAHADIDIALLDALEHPLQECLVVLSPFRVTEASVSVGSDELRIAISVAERMDDGQAVLAAADDLITSFFDVVPADDAASVSLVGSLR